MLYIFIGRGKYVSKGGRASVIPKVATEGLHHIVSVKQGKISLRDRKQLVYLVHLSIIY